MKVVKSLIKANRIGHYEDKNVPIAIGENFHYNVKYDNTYGAICEHVNGALFWMNKDEYEVIEEDVVSKENMEVKPISAWNIQQGGSHYKQYKVQPMEFCMANNFNALQFAIIKYICRYKDKNGVQDIDKAIHCCEMLKEWEIKNK